MSFTNIYDKFRDPENIVYTQEDNIYNKIQNINNKKIFKYIFIIIVSLLYFRTKNINLNVILALIIGTIIIIYLNGKNKTDLTDKQIEKEIKIDNIKPDPNKISEYNDILDFIFSIQDMYEYNPQSYEEMLDNINAFLSIYNIILDGTPYCEYHYQIASSKKDNAVNSLHSIIYNTPSNKMVMDKHTRAHKRLETILNVYLNKLYDTCHNSLIINGYNIYKKQINLGPKEYNNYDDKDFTFQFY